MNVKDKSQDKEIQKITLLRLSQDQYKVLEKRALSKITFRDETNPVQSGYLNGVHDVLRILRDDFTTA